MSEKINVYISSKNRQPEEQIYNFTCRFGDGLLKADTSEYFNLTVCGFHTINCWYNVIIIIIIIKLYLEIF